MPLLPRHKEQAAAFRAHKRGRPSIHELTVAAVTRLTDDAVAVTFDVPEGLRQYYRFKHGQHVSIVHSQEGGEIRRSYSICVPASSEELRVGIRRVDGGAFSTWAAESLAVGDTVRVMTPTGSFTTELDASRAGRYVAVAGGSGITPILSMLGTILEAEPRSEITLLYANRTRESTMFRDELEALEAAHGGRLRVHHFWSREQDGPRRLDGAALAELLDGELRPDAVDTWLMCGPEELTHQVAEALRGRGVPEERVHRELFHAEQAPVDLPDHDRPLLDSEVVLRFDGRDVTLPLSSHGETVLSAALPLVPELPYSCSDGVCATCRAKLVEGEVEMDRCSALEAAEREEGWVLVCQAHPVSPRVVLDFDA
jgi:ring-1,2-phenylacetyl-CoA epoxidase subunit PaaE